MTQELRAKSDKAKEGWYWCTSDDGVCHGPFATEEEARQAMWGDGFGEDQYHEIYEGEDEEDRPSQAEFLAGWEWISHMARQPIRCDVFDADDVLERLEECNEESCWDKSPPNWNDDKAKRELEAMLADALVRWGDKHKAWDQFRGLT